MKAHVLFHIVVTAMILGCGASQPPISPGRFQGCQIEKRSLVDLAQQDVQMKWLCPDARGFWKMTIHCEGLDLTIDGESAERIAQQQDGNTRLPMQFMLKTKISCPSGWTIKPDEERGYHGKLSDSDVNR